MLCYCFLAILVVASASIDGSQDYSGYKVVRAVPSNQEQLNLLKELKSGESYDYDFWTEAERPNGNADIMVSPKKVELLQTVLSEHAIQSRVMIDDVQSLIENERPILGTRQRSDVNATMNWEGYQTLEIIFTWLDALELVFPGLVTLEDIGLSYEGRPLRVVKISSGGADPKFVFWIDSTIHAREWISTGISTYIINELVTKSHLYTLLLSGIDFYILPVINPDGYEFTHTTNRMWRKTRTDHNSTQGCVGVDANRNFGFQYGGPGSSTDKCSDIYLGPEAYSESETASIVSYLNNNVTNPRKGAFISLHSYGLQWISPWAYTSDEYPEDYQELVDLSNEAVAELKTHYNTTFRTGRPDNVYSGFSTDWAKAEGGFKYVYLLELRDTGDYGFLLPPEQIIPSAIETWAGIQVVARHLLRI